MLYVPNIGTGAADKLLRLLSTLNRTTDGGYWHKDRYPYQMWLDGLYMGGVFTMKYAQQYNKPHLFDEVLFQERLMRSHTKDQATGLFYHAWDESRTMPWADPVSGQSPEFWGRALGWYALSIVEFLDLLPEDHPAREELAVVLRELSEALVRYQDPLTGLWHQVIDKGAGRTIGWKPLAPVSSYIPWLKGFDSVIWIHP